MYNDSANNRLLVGGNFFKIGNDTIGFFGIYDGDSLKPLNNELINSDVFSSIIFQNNIIICGWFTAIGNNNSIKRIARWDGNQWQPMGDGFNNAVWNLKIIDNELYAIGGFDSSGTIETHGIAKWNGVNWENVYNLPKFDSIPNNPNLVYDICKYNNELYVGGNFSTNDISISDIVKYNGSTWESVGGGLKGSYSDVNKMLVYNGKLVVAGMFYKQNGNAGDFIMTWDGQNWEELGGGTGGINNTPGSLGTIFDMKIFNNKLYICGQFYYAGDVQTEKVAVWDGNKWCGYFGSFDNLVYSLSVFQDTLYIGSGLTINGDTVNYFAKWSGGLTPDTCGSVGIQENIISEKINIYPNPSQESIFVNNIKLQADYEIYNQLGEKVLDGKYNSKGINIKSLSKGLYLIRLKVNKDTYSSTFIKQ